MRTTTNSCQFLRFFPKKLLFLASLCLAACGGGGSPADAGNAAGPLGTVTLELNLAQPAGEILPASVFARAVPLDGDLLAATALNLRGNVRPMASGIDYATYTPAQIRNSYAMQALPDWRAALSPEQSAALGAGQTIYLVTAYQDAQIAQELEAFNARFDLPPCQVSRLSTPQALPLPGANAEGCALQIVSSTSAGNIATALPAYNAAWARETALDVQWAHATAPLARLVLIEAEDATLGSMLGAIKLANKMGPGVVSMSFGCPEGRWTADTDALFSQTNMSYVAATGDGGPEVLWPAVSTRVLAVGGTTLRYAPGAARTESSWASTGGGFSAYTVAPSYQRTRLTGQSMRGVADVAMNADPNTGQYVARIAPGSSTPTWTSAGGTSLAAVQWSGLLAVANAQRQLAGKAPLGSPHDLIYGSLTTSNAAQADALIDITGNSREGCGGGEAATGYDTATGLGTPNVTNLLALLIEGQESSSAGSAPNGQDISVGPQIQADLLQGTAGKPLSGTITFSDPVAVKITVTISGVPAGVQWSTSGATVRAQWATPQPGTYPLIVSARNDRGQKTQANLPLTVN